MDKCDHVLGVKGNILVHRSAVLAVTSKSSDLMVCDILFKFCPFCGHRNISEKIEREVLKNG